MNTTALVKPEKNILSSLAERYPAFQTTMPLALGVGKQLLELSEELGTSRKQIRLCVARWTQRPSYLHALAKAGAQRHDLNGNPIERVSEEHRSIAKTQLDELKKIAKAAKKKADGAQTKPVEVTSAPEPQPSPPKIITVRKPTPSTINPVITGSGVSRPVLTLKSKRSS